jgi:hypothetical protein
MAGVPDDRRVRRDVVDDDGVRPDLRPVADRDRAEELGAGPDRHVVLDRRMALAGREARAPQRDALVERHVVADLGGLPDHDAGAVVDEERLADPRRRVDLDARRAPRDAREAARHEVQARVVQRMRDAMDQQRLHAGPDEQDLGRRDVARCRVALSRRPDVPADLAHDPEEHTQHLRGGDGGPSNGRIRRS